MTKALLVGEAYGEKEAEELHPFVGSSGLELAKMLYAAGLVSLPPDDSIGPPPPWDMRVFWESQRPNISLTNVVNERPSGNRFEAFCCKKAELPKGYNLSQVSQGAYLRPEYLPELERLRKEIVSLKPNVVITLGNPALWALCGKTGITKMRGAATESSLVPGQKVLPTFHPAYIMRVWNDRVVSIQDFIKAKREAEYPEIRRPKRDLWIEPTLWEIGEFFIKYMGVVKLMAVDIETSPSRRIITCIGFSPFPEAAITIPFVDKRKPGYNYWPDAEQEAQAWQWVRRFLADPVPKVFQNGMYDIQWLMDLGFHIENCDEDTMLLHHALQPEMKKDLGFLGSIYTNEIAWKLMRPRARDRTEKREE